MTSSRRQWVNSEIGKVFWDLFFFGRFKSEIFIEGWFQIFNVLAKTFSHRLLPFPFKFTLSLCSVSEETRTAMIFYFIFARGLAIGDVVSVGNWLSSFPWVGYSFLSLLLCQNDQPNYFYFIGGSLKKISNTPGLTFSTTITHLQKEKKINKNRTNSHFKYKTGLIYLFKK